MRRVRTKRTARDFVNLWRSKFKEATGKDYEVTWVLEAGVFKKLQSKYTNREIVLLINFAFSGHKSTNFLISTGYSISMFRRSVNSFFVNMTAGVSESDFDLETPFWDDPRISWLYSKIVDGKINELIEVISDENDWKLLMEKMKIQSGNVPEKVLNFFTLWKEGVPIKRRAVNGYQRRRHTIS